MPSRLRSSDPSLRFQSSGALCGAQVPAIWIERSTALVKGRTKNSRGVLHKCFEAGAGLRLSWLGKTCLQNLRGSCDRSREGCGDQQSDRVKSELGSAQQGVAARARLARHAKEVRQQRLGQALLAGEGQWPYDARVVPSKGWKTKRRTLAAIAFDDYPAQSPARTPVVNESSAIT